MTGCVTVDAGRAMPQHDGQRFPGRAPAYGPGARHGRAGLAAVFESSIAHRASSGRRSSRSLGSLVALAGAWKTFLRSHWDAIAACDFFTVEVLTWTGLTRFCVLFVIALETRHVEIAGISPPANLNRPGPIVCRERLGGLLRFYDREAA